MALSQLFWDVLMPWNLKSTYFSLKIINCLSLNIWYVIYVVFWIKYWNLKLPHHCILFLVTICTVSQLFGNRVCIYNFNSCLAHFKYIGSLRTGIMAAEYPVMSTSQGTYIRIEQTSEAIRVTYEICRAGGHEDWNWEPLLYGVQVRRVC